VCSSDLYAFCGCNQLSTIHFLWPDGNEESPLEVDLESLLGLQHCGSPKKACELIKNIDLKMANGSELEGRELIVRNCGSDRRDVVLNQENNWSWSKTVLSWIKDNVRRLRRTY
jgi:hypothetical protein